MKSNKEIVKELDNFPPWLHEDDVFNVMKIAQVEAIKELVKRKYDGRPIGTPGKTTDEIAFELIEEIES